MPGKQFQVCFLLIFQLENEGGSLKPHVIRFQPVFHDSTRLLCKNPEIVSNKVRGNKINRIPPRFLNKHPSVHFDVIFCYIFFIPVGQFCSEMVKLPFLFFPQFPDYFKKVFLCRCSIFLYEFTTDSPPRIGLNSKKGNRFFMYFFI